jgi:hypothetical protein
VIESRVLRGGSWNNNQDNARADNRNHNHPNNRNNNIGFRVVCSSHIFPHLPRPGAFQRRAREQGFAPANRAHFRHCPPTTVGGPRRGREDGAGASRPRGPASPGRRAHTAEGRRPGLLLPGAPSVRPVPRGLDRAGRAPAAHQPGRAGPGARGRTFGAWCQTALRSARSQPPNRRPISATMPPAWAYCPSLSQRQRWARRR